MDHPADNVEQVMDRHVILPSIADHFFSEIVRVTIDVNPQKVSEISIVQRVPKVDQSRNPCGNRNRYERQDPQGLIGDKVQHCHMKILLLCSGRGR